MPEFMTIEQVAATLQLGKRTVYDRLRAGRIPGAAKVAGKWRVDRAKLLAWMAAGAELIEDTEATKADPASGDRR